MTKGKELFQSMNCIDDPQHYKGTEAMPLSMIVNKARPRSYPATPFVMDYMPTGTEPETDMDDSFWKGIATDLKNLAEEAKTLESNRTERQQRILDIWSVSPQLELEEGVMKEYLAHSAQGHTIFDSFDMIEGRTDMHKEQVAIIGTGAKPIGSHIRELMKLNDKDLQQEQPLYKNRAQRRREQREGKQK